MKLIKRNKRIAAFMVAALAVPLTAAAATGASDAPDEDAAFEVEIDDVDMAEAEARFAACQLRMDLVDTDGVHVEETRESREGMYFCLAEVWPQWYDANPTPMAPPADWEPDASQLTEQSAFTDYLSEMLTLEGIEHTIKTDANGAEWVDYDEFDPKASSGVSEIIARGDHLPEGHTVVPA